MMMQVRQRKIPIFVWRYYLPAGTVACEQSALCLLLGPKAP
jgi:hypothetical protein